MDRAIENAAAVRGTTAPNPWVGAAVLGSDGRLYDGATRPPGVFTQKGSRSISPVKRPGERRWLQLLNLVVMWEELLHA